MDELTEEKAREMDAWSDLNRIILVSFFGWEAHETSGHLRMDGRSTTTTVLIGPRSDFNIFGITRCPQDSPPQFSTNWSAAGVLLEAMGGKVDTNYRRATCEVKYKLEGYNTDTVKTDAPKPQLAISRACGVLVAREISRNDLEKSYE